MSVVAIVFWVSVAFVAYVYLGYPLIVSALARLGPRPIRRRPITPSITVLIAAHNEEARIGHKVRNCLDLDYPPHELNVLVVSDGSTDRTPAIVGELAAQSPERVRLVALPDRHGKAYALTAGAALASGEILILADARQEFALDVARNLVRNFADPDVGAVSGELLLRE
ncbi:MAG: glycosyltransferase, partial [bacterium]